MEMDFDLRRIVIVRACMVLDLPVTHTRMHLFLETIVWLNLLLFVIDYRHVPSHTRRHTHTHTHTDPHPQ